MPEEPHETILQEAEHLIHGPRHEDYGPPDEDWGCALDMWLPWVCRKYHNSMVAVGDLRPADFGVLMALYKLARHAHKAKRDNLTDACGYLGGVAQVEGFDPPQGKESE